MLSKLITIPIAALMVLLGASSAQAAVPRRHSPLVSVHACRPMATNPPAGTVVTGYLVGLHSDPRAPLFYKGAGEMTSGLMYGWGGDWVLRDWCTR